MARFIGAKTKIARKFKEAIYGPDKNFEKRNYPPGQHGQSRKRSKPTEYAIQLSEKQKAKYTYGLLERQFYKTFEEAARKKGVTGENLMKQLEARLDNTVFRMGFAKTRSQVVGIREKSQSLEVITDSINSSNPAKFNWLNVDTKAMQGTFLTFPERDSIPENIKEQLIVELYSK
jgi:small subunit ribosomal protein S4